ncbi:hypothetical protein ACFY94_07660 [Streptomyces griseorubiginosus]|uniref:hypothetical protein n=1 Tax=Streptomyces griseorubiginosus TaxID=67304 RepID=UPI0036EA04CB
MGYALALVCDACHRPIGDNDGHLWIEDQAVNQVQAAARQWEADHPDGVISAFGDFPEDVPWQAHHTGCAPETGSYAIPAEEIRTWQQLLEWTAHLMEKAWLSCTDWDEVLRGVHNGKHRLIAAPAK